MRKGNEEKYIRSIKLKKQGISRKDSEKCCEDWAPILHL